MGWEILMEDKKRVIRGYRDHWGIIKDRQVKNKYVSGLEGVRRRVTNRKSRGFGRACRKISKTKFTVLPQSDHDRKIYKIGQTEAFLSNQLHVDYFNHTSLFSNLIPLWYSWFGLFKKRKKIPSKLPDEMCWEHNLSPSNRCAFPCFIKSRRLK